MNAAKVTVTLTDDSFSQGSSITGITGFMGQMVRGPIGNTSMLFNSWSQFQKIFGGLSPTSDGPYLAKRMLDRGVTLRINNIRHYTDITDPSTLTALPATCLATKVYTLSAAPVAGQVMSFALASTTITQAFTTDAVTTLNLWGAAVVAAFPQVLSYFVTSGTKIQFVVLTGSPTVTVTGSGSLPTATLTTLTGFYNATGTKLFDILPIYPGAAYNGLVVSILPPSNGQVSAGYFNISVQLTNDPTFIPEVYQNLIIPGSPTLPNCNYLNNIVLGSSIVKVVYYDLSGVATTPITPLTNYSAYSGGSDGGGVVAGDYIGDQSAKTGIHAYDSIYDCMSIGSDSVSDAVGIGCVAYADARGDLQYVHHFDNALDDANALVADKQAMGIDSEFGSLWTGGVNAINQLTGQPYNSSGIAEVLSAASISETQFGAWYSFAGVNRGLIKNALGVVNNFAAAGDTLSLDLLANNQINALVSEGGDLYLAGNFSAQLANSMLSFNNVVRLTIYLKKNLRQLVKPFLEEPNDIPTWKAIYMAVKPFLDGLAVKRALAGEEGVGWSWQGDQFAKDLNSLLINNPTDVGNGIYKVKFFYIGIASLQQLGINMIITNSTVSFESAASTPTS